MRMYKVIESSEHWDVTACIGGMSFTHHVPKAALAGLYDNEVEAFLDTVKAACMREVVDWRMKEARKKIDAARAPKPKPAPPPEPEPEPVPEQLPGDEE
jgi:hypothetical protein